VQLTIFFCPVDHTQLSAHVGLNFHMKIEQAVKISRK